MRAPLAWLVLLACVAAPAALAATLAVSSAGLTTWSAASTIPASSCSLEPSGDSYVDSVSSGSNFGTATDLQVQSSVVGNRRTFIRFNVDSCVPAGARVTAATLSLHLSTAPSASRTYDAHRVTAAWTESGVTWSGQPSVAGAATSSTATGTTSGVTLSWNVAADVQAFADGTTNHGWRLADQTESSLVTRQSVFPSREAASSRPALAVTFYP